VIKTEIPPLRRRKEDIPLLIQHFLEKYSQETTKRVDHVSVQAIKLLKQFFLSPTPYGSFFKDTIPS